MEVIMEPEKCRKCGNNVFEARHKGPHIGWYCTKCGAWLRWIPQHNECTCCKCVVYNFDEHEDCPYFVSKKEEQ